MSDRILIKGRFNEVEQYKDNRSGDNTITIFGNFIASDGAHTFEELYDHRNTLFIALLRNINEVLGLENPGKYKIWRSKSHSDGSEYKNWFILGIGEKAGEQITYHLPIERWGETEFAETLNYAPAWDNHTPADVLERLKSL